LENKPVETVMMNDVKAQCVFKSNPVIDLPVPPEEATNMNNGIISNPKVLIQTKPRDLNTRDKTSVFSTIFTDDDSKITLDAIFVKRE
jgi:hypothetical protein